MSKNKNQGGNNVPDFSLVVAGLGLALVVFLAVWGIPNWSDRIYNPFVPTPTPRMDNVILRAEFNPAVFSLEEIRDATYTLTMADGKQFDVPAEVGAVATPGAKFDFDCFCVELDDDNVQP